VKNWIVSSGLSMERSCRPASSACHGYLVSACCSGLLSEAYLGDAVRGKLHAVVRDELVDVAVLVALRLRMADHYDHLRRVLAGQRRGLESAYAGLPHLDGCVGGRRAGGKRYASGS
jgi:hypothetical protein